MARRQRETAGAKEEEVTMANIMRVEPFNELVSLRDAMDRLFEDSFVRPGPRWMVPAGESRCGLPIDAYITDEELVITASVPGVPMIRLPPF